MSSAPDGSSLRPRARERRRFIILGRYRSGSTLLARTLKQHPSLVVHEEIFNLNNLSRDQEMLAAPLASVRRLLEADQEPRIRAVGFKLMYQQATRAELDRDHWHPGPTRKISAAIDAIEARIAADRHRCLDELERTWTGLHEDPDLRVVHLIRRDGVASFASFVLAMTDDLWIDVPYSTRRIHIDPDRCRAWCDSAEELSRHYAALFASHPTLEVTYEELTTRHDSVIREVLDFLGVDAIPLPPATARQRTRSLDEIVENYEELCRIFDRAR